MKNVLVVIDKREATASRKKDGIDLITLWTDYLGLHAKDVNYQIAFYPLDIGDVWITETPFPVKIPEKWAFFKQPAAPKTIDIDLDDYFQMPSDVPSNPLSLPNAPIVASVVEDDAAFLPKNPMIVIERKSLSDLQSSIGDGRYHEQKMRLVQSDAKMVMLLIEGYNGGLKIKGETEKKKLLSVFTHTLMRDNISVYHTQNIKDTFEFLQHLATEMAAGKLERPAEYMERTK